MIKNFANPQATMAGQRHGVPHEQWWPACLCAEDAARFLGWPPYFLTLLVRAGHLKPLGKPAQNSRKWYATVELARLGSDPEWLDKALRIVEKRVQTANAKQAGKGRSLDLPSPTLN